MRLRYPCVEIDINKIRQNTRYIVDYCDSKGIEVMGITKGVCALIEVVNAMLEGGIKKLGDSRLQNIAALRESGLQGLIYLIRIPMLSEIRDLVYLADGSFNSEVDAVKMLSQEASAIGKAHKVILMVDVGDLREGVMPEDVLNVVGQIINLPSIELEGLGTNVGCYGGVLASYENTKVMVDLAEEIEKRYGIKVKTLSGGNTAALTLLEKCELASGINQFRIGEGILLGTDATNFRKVPGTWRDTMRLKTEAIEVKVKPSYPIGEIGRDSFGNIPIHQDKGPIRRAIVALGKQDCRIEGLTPVGKSMEILGASSDHLLIDVTKRQEIKVGDVIEFDMTYGAMLSLMTSKYVNKIVID
jgi:predicted amino acid racemase